ncbi:MAG: hypothetical protein ACT4OX_11730 [Actinomycetota bacterium]
MRRSRFVAMVMMGSLVFAACGGDDDDEADSPSAAVDDDEAGDDESPDEDVDADVDPDDIDLDDLEDIEGFDEDCVEASLAMAGAMSGAFTGEAIGDDESLEQFRELADNAPDEIADDLQTLADALGEYYEALADAGVDLGSGDTPDADDIAALTELGESLNTEEVQAASDNVSTWFEEGCP